MFIFSVSVDEKIFQIPSPKSLMVLLKYRPAKREGAIIVELVVFKLNR